MRNFWLQRRPKIYQQTNPYADFYGKWFIYKRSDELGCDLYLHTDGVWRVTTFNINSGLYSGYFDSEKEAEEALEKSTKNH
jgi:hypothetical protein